MKGRRGIIERVDRTRGTTKVTILRYINFIMKEGQTKEQLRGKVDQRERDYVRYMSLTTFCTTFGCFRVFHPGIL